MTDVATFGTFDGMHPGHVGLLERCRNIANSGLVTVGVNTDEFVEKFKHVTPIYNLEERVIMVDAVRYVDNVLVNDGTEQPRLILSALPAGGILVIGDDWRDRDYYAQIDVEHGWFEDSGITLRYVPRTGDWSTTELRTRLA